MLDLLSFMDRLADELIGVYDIYFENNSVGKSGVANVAHYLVEIGAGIDGYFARYDRKSRAIRAGLVCRELTEDERLGIFFCWGEFD